MTPTPYADQARPDTGFTNGELALALALAAQLMLFGSLIASYVLLQVGAAPGVWPAVGHRGAHPLAPAAPAALTLSLVTASMATRRPRGPSSFSGWRWATLVLGIVALGALALDWRFKWGAGHRPATSTYDACYFVLSGLVALELLVGVAALARIGRRGEPVGAESIAARRREGGLAPVYWLFVAVTGGIAFAVLYHL